jgi:hypothetical protein
LGLSHDHQEVPSPSGLQPGPLKTERIKRFSDNCFLKFL